MLGKTVNLYPNITGTTRSIGHLFRTEGVTNRLRVNDIEKIEPGSYDFPYFRENVASHGVGGYDFTLDRNDARILHQARNKVHVAGGYTRFQKNGTTDIHDMEPWRPCAP